jgi:putative membrane protein
MKIYRNSMTRLARAAKTGAVLSVAIFATSALQAQSSVPNNPNNTPPPENSQPPAASADNSGKISHRAKEFLEDASQANQMEIALAGVAQEKSQNATVKALAQTLRSDHEKNLAQVQSLAQAHGVTLDDSVSWMNQRIVNHMQKASDADFDKDYTKMMVKDHVACIKNFDKAAADVKESDINQYVQNTLPTLRTHLQRSEEAARSVGVDDATISSIRKGLPTEEMGRGVTYNQ